jgi:hypothetical protein
MVSLQSYSSSPDVSQVQSPRTKKILIHNPSQQKADLVAKEALQSMAKTREDHQSSNGHQTSFRGQIVKLNTFSTFEEKDNGVNPQKVKEIKQANKAMKPEEKEEVHLKKYSTTEDSLIDSAEKRPLLLQSASEQQRDQTDVVRNAVKKDGYELANASERLKNDPLTVMVAVKQDGLALQFASPVVQGNKVVVLAAVTKDGLALQFASKLLRSDPQVVAAATHQNKDARYFASDAFKETSNAEIDLSFHLAELGLRKRV